MFNKNIIWNTALLEVSGNPFQISKARELQVFSSKSVRRSKHAIHTQADPFLFVHKNYLYLFLEVQQVGLPGHIEAYRTADCQLFEHLGPVLRSKLHYSYPQVISVDSEIYMVPESASAFEVAIYRFEAFPFGLYKHRTLLKGNYADSTLFQHNGFWWIFTTSTVGLELHFSPNLDEKFQQHPIGIITNEHAFSRCGGSVLKVDDCIYRPAQDCSIAYGGNLSMMRIEELTPTTYSESCAYRNIFDRQAVWRSQGAHHFSLTTFNGRTIIAVDGQQQDYWINRPISLISKVINGLHY